MSWVTTHMTSLQLRNFVQKLSQLFGRSVEVNSVPSHWDRGYWSRVVFQRPFTDLHHDDHIVGLKFSKNIKHKFNNSHLLLGTDEIRRIIQLKCVDTFVEGDTLYLLSEFTFNHKGATNISSFPIKPGDLVLTASPPNLLLENAKGSYFWWRPITGKASLSAYSAMYD